jgi:hypothetical protein
MPYIRALRLEIRGSNWEQLEVLLLHRSVCRCQEHCSSVEPKVLLKLNKKDPLPEKSAPDLGDRKEEHSKRKPAPDCRSLDANLDAAPSGRNPLLGCT